MGYELFLCQRRVNGKDLGKYGTDILLVGGSVKAIKAYRNLRNANNLMTIEGMTKALKKDTLVELSKNWENQTKKAIEEATKDLTGRELYKELRHLTDENQLRKALHKFGIETFEKPKGVPKDWAVKVTGKNGGMKYLKNNHNYIRVMPGDPSSKLKQQRKPYVIQMKNGQHVDKSGKIVLRDSPEAHIPLKEFTYLGEEF